MFNFCKFRCGGHRLPVETGRWHNVSRADRLCRLYDSVDIGNEFPNIYSYREVNNNIQQIKFCVEKLQLH
jgi:hypothetical protein